MTTTVRSRSTVSPERRAQLKEQIKRELEEHHLREELIREVEQEMLVEDAKKAIEDLEKGPKESQHPSKHRIKQLIFRIKELKSREYITKGQYELFINRLKKIRV